MTERLEAYYGLPEDVVFCKKCVMSNQRPASMPEFTHDKATRHVTLNLDEDGVCDACRFAEKKEEIDWEQREKDLLELLDTYRKNDGSYDCVAPGSGGKDSVYAAHILKYKYGMHPLTCTWPPILYTEVGRKNFENWLNVGGFNNLSFHYNGKVHALLTRLAIGNLLHPFQPFILGQKNLAPKIAMAFNIPLVFYGENEAEYGNPISDNMQAIRDRSYFTYRNTDDIRISGVSFKELREKHGLDLSDIRPYLPAPAKDLADKNIDVRYLGYYLKWTPQEAYYYSVENTEFEANPFRTEGTYSKYNSLDDKIDGFHYYTTYIKFGIGRATYDASQEIRNKHITREEGVALVKRFDGEFPEKYFDEIMDYIGMSKNRFLELCDNARSPHLWKRENSEWKLRYRVE